MNTLNKKAALPFASILRGFKGHISDLRTLTPSKAWEHAFLPQAMRVKMLQTPGGTRRNSLQAAALLAIAKNKPIKYAGSPILLDGSELRFRYPGDIHTPIPDSKLDGYTKGLLSGKNNWNAVDEAGFRYLIKNNPDATAADIFRKAYPSKNSLRLTVPIDGRLLRPGLISAALGYRDFHNAMRKTKAFKEYMRLTQPRKFPFSHLFHGTPVTTLGQMAEALRNLF